MKKFEFNPGQSFVGILAAVVLGILLAFYSLILLWPQGNPYDSVKVTIPKGASLKEVSTTLQDYNIIRNERSFLLAVKTLGYEKDMPAGRFKLVKASTNFDIIDQLVNGIQVNKRVTILEGWTIDVIAEELHDKIGIDQDEFKSACTNELLLWKWGISEKTVEGYLFPNTYLFSEEEDVQDIIGRMINEYKQRITLEFRDRMQELGMEEKEIITLASIIEGEAIYDKERAVISGVYHNRLNIGMRLQADPTIQYIINDSPRRLLNKDLKIKSPYNTYLNKGLPPGPINNPGLSALIASVNPEKSDYFYFVSDTEGGHMFSRNVKEHKKAVKIFKRKRKLKRK